MKYLKRYENNYFNLDYFLDKKLNNENKRIKSYKIFKETYYPHQIVDPNDRNVVPVVDYVDVDYFDYDVAMDETEPPNATGRDDSQTKNKTKKPAARISVA